VGLHFETGRGAGVDAGADELAARQEVWPPVNGDHLHLDPGQSLTPVGTCDSPFFDALKIPGVKMPNGKPVPPLFDFAPHGR